VLHPGIVPHIPERPGAVRWPGPPVGAHNDEVFTDLLGLPNAATDGLRREGVI
jgi:crotonobetainyl-CoA:carnitine CoA-transferase CaiB-like acyl-CoA transferase